MSLLDYILIGVLAIWVILSLLYLRRSKKRKKCAGCSHTCASCPNNINKNDKK